MTDEQVPPPNDDHQLQRWRPNGAQYAVAVIVLVTGLVVLWIRLNMGHPDNPSFALQGTSALYLGVPLLLALAVVLSPRAKSPYGMVVKAVTAVLLMSIVFLGEGLICIIMAAPLFYGVGLLVAWAIDSARKRDQPMRALVLLPLAILSTEGVTPATTVGQLDSATSSIVVPATAEEVERALAQPLLFDQSELPMYLSMGFPTPVEAQGTGLELGDQRVVKFDGAAERPRAVPDHHWTTNGSTLTMTVAASSPGHITFVATEDTTPIASWLQWKTADVRWTAQSNGTTEVEWTVNYERRLSPSWYFSPWQQYAAGLSADYLLKSLDLPR